MTFANIQFDMRLKENSLLYIIRNNCVSCATHSRTMKYMLEQFVSIHVTILADTHYNPLKYLWNYIPKFIILFSLSTNWVEFEFLNLTKLIKSDSKWIMMSLQPQLYYDKLKNWLWLIEVFYLSNVCMCMNCCVLFSPVERQQTNSKMLLGKKELISYQNQFKNQKEHYFRIALMFINQGHNKEGESLLNRYLVIIISFISLQWTEFIKNISDTSRIKHSLKVKEQMRYVHCNYVIQVRKLFFSMSCDFELVLISYC